MTHRVVPIGEDPVGAGTSGVCADAVSAHATTNKVNSVVRMDINSEIAGVEMNHRLTARAGLAV